MPASGYRSTQPRMPAYVPPHLRRQQQAAPPASHSQTEPQPAPQPDAYVEAAATTHREFQTHGHGVDEPQPAAAAARELRQARLQEEAQRGPTDALPATAAPSWSERSDASARVRSSATRAVQRATDLDAAVAALVAADARVGFPQVEPAVDPNPHGWFFPPHRVVMSNLMSAETSCVLELGSWLGKSTRFIAERAPNAYVFAVDLWSNEHIRADPHYTDQGGESAFMAHKAARARQIEENLRIIDTAPIYDVFLKNLWAQRPAAGSTGTGTGGQDRTPCNGGVVPMKMCCKDGIELLAAAGIVPDCIYVDASHHYDDVLQDLAMCLERFPSARICGDDWDYPPVQRAAVDAAEPLGAS